jgi:hypothetical protein
VKEIATAVIESNDDDGVAKWLEINFKKVGTKMKISQKYVEGIKQAYYSNNGIKEWVHFEKIKHGASAEGIQKLKEVFPNIPDSLINLLEYADGTYFRKYQDDEITLYFLGSDVDEGEYPYYLLSAEQMLERYDESQNFGDLFFYSEQEEYGVTVDAKIQKDTDTNKWLCFSDCMNNGGTSVLYIDFTPSENGKVGQVLRFLHDPDEIIVIADSFDDYLKMLIDKEYAFVREEMVNKAIYYGESNET